MTNRFPLSLRSLARSFLRWVIFVCVGLPFTAALVSAASQEAAKPVIVFVHGTWAGGWQFKKVQPLLEARGFEVWRPTLTGVGERSHLAHRDIGLETHIEDIVNFIRFEKLTDVILVGHSYGGMVVAGVADRVPDRIKHIVYLDAIVPGDGDSVLGLFGSRVEQQFERFVKDGFIIPPWVKAGAPWPHDMPHPIKTYTDKIALKNPAAKGIPTTYILTVEKGKKAEQDDFYSQSLRAKERSWVVLQLEADHNPQQSAPEALADLIAGIR